MVRSCMTSAVEIHDPAVAEFLSDRQRSRHLDPFLARESSIADAAQLLGVSPQRMHYWTRRLVGLKLIDLVRIEASGRQRTRIFRSVADSFHVPLELLPTSDVDTLGLYFEPIWQNFLRSVAMTGRRYAAGWYVRYSRVSDKAAFHIVPAAPTQPDLPLLNSWAKLRLTREQALLLRQQLAELIQQHLDQPPARHSREYIAHVALVEDAGID